MAITDERTIESFDVVEATQQIAEHLHELSTDVHQLTYSPLGEHSYYQDLVLRGLGARKRLQRHAEEMEQVARERRAQRERLLRSGQFEFRVEPNRTDGQGGYFSPPLWLNELFATANRPGRILSGLMRRFPLPRGVSSVNLPLISTGTLVQTSPDGAAAPDRDFTDSAGSSMAVPLVGQADVGLQLLEQSPPGAYLDWAIFQDLSEDYDYQLEIQLLFGTGGTSTAAQLLGVMQVPSINAIAYTAGSPTGVGIDPFLGNAMAKIGDSRLRPPECWLMRTARWAWFMTAEDGASSRPFGLDTRFYLGNDDDTPDPISGFLGLPVFLNDAIPANLTATTSQGTTTYTNSGTQDVVICLRPTDLLLLEGEPRSDVYREPLSAQLGARIQLHNYAAAVTGRRPASISVVSGTGLAVQPGE